MGPQEMAGSIEHSSHWSHPSITSLLGDIFENLLCSSHAFNRLCSLSSPGGNVVFIELHDQVTKTNETQANMKCMCTIIKA